MKITIGRNEDCDLVLSDDSVSGLHAEVREEAGHFFLADLGSTNGTYVNRSRVSLVELTAGDVVHFGVVRSFFDGHRLVEHLPAAKAQSTQSESLRMGKRVSRHRQLWIAAVSVAAVVAVVMIRRGGSVSVADIARGTVQVFVSDPSGDWCSSGSGFLALGDGIVVTNAHVVTDAECQKLSIGVVDDSGDRVVREIPATLVVKNATLDLAVLQVDPIELRGYPKLKIARRAVTRGEEIRVFGFPVIGGATLTTTSGIISGVDEESEYPFFKTNADISAGNSGGPAVNAAGHVIGIATAAILQTIDCDPDETCYSAGNSLGLLRPISWLQELYP